MRLVKTRKMIYQERISELFYNEFEKRNKICYNKWMLNLRVLKRKLHTRRGL